MTFATWITLARLALVIPLSMGFEGLIPSSGTFWCYLLASSTDWIDGWVARKFDQASELGALLDPLVDKVLVTASLVGLLKTGLIPPWSVTLILTREFLVTGLRAVVVRQGLVMKASPIGKWKTVTQMVAIGGLLGRDLVPGALAPARALWWVAVLLTLVSAGEYLWSTRSVWSSREV
jgi:CDP-diacylglycerol--glycerol-3-phosphate 3-phosphatidyltransferase